VPTPNALTRVGAAADRAAQLFPVRVARKFIDHGGPNEAVIIAWNSLTAVFPIALALAAIVGLVLNKAGVTPQTVANQIGSLVPTDLGTQQAVIEGINSLQQQTGLFALAALVGFVWTASGLFGAMEAVFATVYETTTRPFIRQKLMALVMMALFVVLALVAVGTSALVPLLNDIPGLPISLTHGDSGAIAQAIIGFVAGFVLYFAIYTVVPNRHQRLSRVLPAALFGGIAFELLTLVWPLYIRLNQVGLNRFGSQFALLFVLLAFFYILGLITVLGADINAVLDPPIHAPSEPDPPPPRQVGRARRAAFGAAALLIGVIAGRRARG